jgi:hypothetical protein
MDEQAKNQRWTIARAHGKTWIDLNGRPALLLSLPVTVVLPGAEGFDDLAKRIVRLLNEDDVRLEEFAEVEQRRAQIMNATRQPAGSKEAQRPMPIEGENS